MPKSDEENEFVNYVVELMQSIGPVSAGRKISRNRMILSQLISS